MKLSYTWVKTALQTAGLVKRARKRSRQSQAAGAPALTLNDVATLTAVSTVGLPMACYYDLIVIMDDANEIYYAQLLEEESTFTVMAALREVIESKGRLRTTYIAEFDQKFSVPAKEAGSAFIAYRRQDLDLVFTLQTERTVARDNTISNDKRLLQSEKTKWRYTLSGLQGEGL